MRKLMRWCAVATPEETMESNRCVPPVPVRARDVYSAGVPDARAPSCSSQRLGVHVATSATPHSTCYPCYPTQPQNWMKCWSDTWILQLMFLWYTIHTVGAVNIQEDYHGLSLLHPRKNHPKTSSPQIPCCASSSSKNLHWAGRLPSCLVGSGGR